FLLPQFGDAKLSVNGPIPSGRTPDELRFTKEPYFLFSVSGTQPERKLLTNDGTIASAKINEDWSVKNIKMQILGTGTDPAVAVTGQATIGDKKDDWFKASFK